MLHPDSQWHNRSERRNETQNTQAADKKEIIAYTSGWI